MAFIFPKIKKIRDFDRKTNNSLLYSCELNLKLFLLFSESETTVYSVPGVGPRPGPSQRAGGLRGRVRGRSLGGEWEPPVRQLRI